MARIGKVLSYSYRTTPEGFRIGDVKIDFGAGRNITAEHYSTPGEEDHPLPGDFAAALERTTGKWVVTGFWDPALGLTAEAGEKILCSRSAPGVVAAKIHLKKDGSIVMNDELVIDASANLTTSGEVTAKQVGLSTHQHPTSMGPSGPPTPGT